MDIHDKIRATKTLINTRILMGESPIHAFQEWGNLIDEMIEKNNKIAQFLLTNK